MCEVRYIKSEKMFPVINEIMDKGSGVRITVTGNSMRPFLREGYDRVELFSVKFDVLGIGDIVMIQRDSGEHVLHRVVKKEKDCFYIAGDAQLWIEGPLTPDQLLAAVKVIWRKDKKIDCKNILLRLLSIMWMYMPLRKTAFYSYRLLKKLYSFLTL